jgi:hypothetical protein
MKLSPCHVGGGIVNLFNLRSKTKPKTIGLEVDDKEEEEAEAGMRSDPTMDLPADLIMDNNIEGGQRLSILTYPL